MAKNGRKTRYNKEILKTIIECAEKGWINKEICKKIGINTKTLYMWLNPESSFYKKELDDALKEAKKIPDQIVEQKLFKRACGYKYKEVTKERALNPKTNEFEPVVTKEVVKEFPPDPTSMIFWLKNRDPQRWRDVRQFEGKMTIEDQLKRLSDKEINKQLEDFEKHATK